jgi:hypothetical protein
MYTDQCDRPIRVNPCNPWFKIGTVCQGGRRRPRRRLSPIDSPSESQTSLRPIGLNRGWYVVGSAERFNRMHVAFNPAGHRQTGFFATDESLAPSALGSTNSGLVHTTFGSMKSRLALVVIVACAVIVAGCTSVRLRGNEASIRNWILSEKPLGSQIDDVAAWVSSRWKNVTVSRSDGFWKEDPPGHRITVGKQAISASLGSYTPFPIGFLVGVGAYWGFDEHGKLIDVWVTKDHDGL